MATVAEHSAFWSVDRWRREYGWRPLPGQENPYRPKGYHRAQDIAAWPGAVPALRGGTVVGTGYGAAIGWWIAIQIAPGVVDGYCHLYGAGGMPADGTVFPKGGNLPRLARADEAHGSAWTGQHLHFIVTTSASGVPNAGLPDADPRPIILAELAQQAGEGGEEFDMPITPEDVARFFHTAITKGPDGVTNITLAQFMANQGFAMATPLIHPITGQPVAAGGYLLSEPAEHKNTRTEIAKLTTMVAALGAAVESMSAGEISAESIQQIADAAEAAAHEGAERAVAIAHAAEMQQLEQIRATQVAALEVMVADRAARVESLEAELEALKVG